MKTDMQKCELDLIIFDNIHVGLDLNMFFSINLNIHKLNFLKSRAKNHYN